MATGEIELGLATLLRMNIWRLKSVRSQLTEEEKKIIFEATNMHIYNDET